MKWILGGIGLSLGLIAGVALMIYAYTLAPGMPGISELTIQLVIVGFLGFVACAIGFGLGCVIDVFRRRPSNSTE